MAIKRLIVVTGPTAVGKTAACLALAQKLGTEIISADARQCYRGMRIGTAQPTAEEQRIVRHHLVDFLPMDHPYSAAAFASDAQKVLERLWKDRDIVVAAGGSGLYIKALCEGLAPMPPIPKEVKEHLQEVYDREGLQGLLADLHVRDPHHYAQVDRANAQRVLRALAVCHASGRPYSAWRNCSLPKPPFRVVHLALTRPRALLYARIAARVEAMVAQGLLAEFAALYPHGRALLARTIGYRELVDHAEGLCSFEEAVLAIKRNTRHYAKRQLTWLRACPEVVWLDATDVEGVLCKAVQK